MDTHLKSQYTFPFIKRNKKGDKLFDGFHILCFLFLLSSVTVKILGGGGVRGGGGREGRQGNSSSYFFQVTLRGNKTYSRLNAQLTVPRHFEMEVLCIILSVVSLPYVQTWLPGTGIKHRETEAVWRIHQNFLAA